MTSIHTKGLLSLVLLNLSYHCLLTTFVKPSGNFMHHVHADGRRPTHRPIHATPVTPLRASSSWHAGTCLRQGMRMSSRLEMTTQLKASSGVILTRLLQVDEHRSIHRQIHVTPVTPMRSSSAWRSDPCLHKGMRMISRREMREQLHVRLSSIIFSVAVVDRNARSESQLFVRHHSSSNMHYDQIAGTEHDDAS